MTQQKGGIKGMLLAPTARAMNHWLFADDTKDVGEASSKEADGSPINSRAVLQSLWSSNSLEEKLL
jgi:hypothetical protein